MSYVGAPGMVGIIAQESARFSTFAESLTNLSLPPGSRIRWRFGWDLADGQNALVAEMLENPDYEWLWFMGDDHVFSPGLLDKLLSHDVDVIVPLCLMRAPPFRPVNWVNCCLHCRRPAVEHTGESGGCPPDCKTSWTDSGGLYVERLDLDDYPDGGLARIEASGAAGLLVHRHVLEAIEPPWFETGTGITNRVGEDVNFCRKVGLAGFNIWCDLDAMLGHSLTTVVWPVREPDGWTFGFSMIGGFQITMPPAFQAYADRVGA